MGTSVQWKQPSPQCAFENNSHTLFITGPTLSVKRQTIGRASSTAGGNLGHTANKGREKKGFLNTCFCAHRVSWHIRILLEIPGLI